MKKNTYIHAILKKILPTSIYFVGMGSLVLADLFVVKYYPDSFIAEWAYLKSILFIGGSILVFGLDQMFIRHSLKVSVYFPKFLKHLLFFSLLFALFQYYKTGKATVVLIIALFGITQVLLGAARANFKYTLSQVLLQSWKILFLFIIVFLFFIPIKTSVYLIISASLIIPILLSLKAIANLMNDGDKKNIKMSFLYQDSALMFLSIISLNIAMYADQIFLKQFATQQDMVRLFSHTASIYPAGIAFNGIAGFFLGPFFKKNPDFSIRKIISIIIPIAGVLSFGSFAIGAFILKFVKQSYFDYSLALLLSAIIGLRIMYILPSSYIGVIGSQRLLKFFVGTCVTGVLIQIIGFLILVNFTNINVIFAAIFSVAAHWLIRTFGGIFLIYYFKNKRELA